MSSNGFLLNYQFDLSSTYWSMPICFQWPCDIEKGSIIPTHSSFSLRLMGLNDYAIFLYTAFPVFLNRLNKYLTYCLLWWTIFGHHISTQVLLDIHLIKLSMVFSSLDNENLLQEETFSFWWLWVATIFLSVYY